MKIPHLVRSGQFRPIVSAAIETKGCPGSLRVDLPLGGGCSGDIEVAIGPAAEQAFEAKVSRPTGANNRFCAVSAFTCPGIALRVKDLRELVLRSL